MSRPARPLKVPFTKFRRAFAVPLSRTGRAADVSERDDTGSQQVSVLRTRRAEELFTDETSAHVPAELAEKGCAGAMAQGPRFASLRFGLAYLAASRSNSRP
jgi:hypothetical protein